VEGLEYHHVPLAKIVHQFETHLEKGLAPEEAAQRLQKYGPNELSEKPRPGFLQMLIGQFNNFLVIILIIAAVASLVLGEMIDALAILIIVLLNAVVGVVQESKAEAALAALKKMAAPTAQVIRGDRQMTIASRDLVPGDVVLVEAGNYIPADLRLAEGFNLKVEEASLTGESVPVEKNARLVLDKDIPLGDRKNMAFMGTLATYGRGKGLVTGTGMHTQIGQIAEMLQSYEEEQTPLQRKLDQLAKVLGIICLTICGVIFIYGLIRDTQFATILSEGWTSYLRKERGDLIELFMTAVSLAIAAIPEGLPAVVTICLALGMQKMIRRHALIRKLPAVETLGCATVICSDKTGTLTQNEMTVVQAWTGGRRLLITGEGYNPVGQFLNDSHSFDPTQDPNASFLLHAGLLCNDAKLEEGLDERGQKGYRIVGDPTEGAMVVAAAKAGISRDAAERVLRRIQEIPFDSDRKRMTTIHQRGTSDERFCSECPSKLALVKGAPDIVLDLCNQILMGGKAIPITPERRKEILTVNQDMARQALRVLGVAYRGLDGGPLEWTSDAVEKNLTFIGLMGMMDPARPEAKEAVSVARGAGLKTVMVTGDYKDTAEAIAREIGIRTSGGKVLTGAELDKLSDEGLSKIVDKVDVCCRVSPGHKTKIVDAFKARGHVVAMTGDGVNDAPALKRANIGVAMGITGTDVSKETADMVLTDDNFASIVSAIEEGRIIYSNIRKFVFYLISCNIGEILIIFVSMLLGFPVPLKPVQLLTLNLATDGAPALALGMEKGDPDIMKRPPRPTQEPVINWEMQVGTLVQAVVMTAAVLLSYYWALQIYPQEAERAQTIAFVTLCMSELLRAFTARSERHGVFAIGIFTNRWMIWAVSGSSLLLLLAVYLPFLQPFFDTVPLSVGDWIRSIPFIFMASIAAEITKAYIRKRLARTEFRVSSKLELEA
jgi:Ca2+-transporting ATPase